MMMIMMAMVTIMMITMITIMALDTAPSIRPLRYGPFDTALSIWPF